jgi:hypothetical protein
MLPQGHLFDHGYDLFCHFFLFQSTSTLVQFEFIGCGVDSGDGRNCVLRFSCRSLFNQLIELLTQTA